MSFIMYIKRGPTTISPAPNKLVKEQTHILVGYKACDWTMCGVVAFNMAFNTAGGGTTYRGCIRP